MTKFQRYKRILKWAFKRYHVQGTILKQDKENYPKYLLIEKLADGLYQ